MRKANSSRQILSSRQVHGARRALVGFIVLAAVPAMAPAAAGVLPVTDVFALTLSQTTSLTDVQTSYREVLTYTASAVL